MDYDMVVSNHWQSEKEEDVFSTSYVPSAMHLNCDLKKVIAEKTSEIEQGII